MRNVRTGFLWLALCLGQLAFGAETPQTIQEDALSLDGRRPIEFGIDLQYLPVSYRQHDWGNGQRTNNSGHGAHLGFEWIPLDERYGKLGIGVGTGFYIIRNIDFGSRRATLTTIPFESYLSYRFDYVVNQILVPFIKVGVNHTLTTQRGIDVPGTRGYWGWDRAAGLELCLNRIDRTAATSLRHMFGIDNSYLIFEYLKSDFLGARKEPDLTHEEFRLGFRFEI